MATNNKLKAKKYNKNKLLHLKNKLEAGIAGCDGCPECLHLHKELNKINEILEGLGLN